MTLAEKLSADLKSAMKERNETKLAVVRQIKAAISAEESRKLKTLEDDAVMSLIISISKAHADSIESFKKGNRQDLVDKEEKELAIIKTYLPEQLDDAELRKIISEAIAETGAKDPKEAGKVMSRVMPKVKGKADGNKVGVFVKELLSKN